MFLTWCQPVTDNPYDSPNLDTTAYVKQSNSGPVKRPIGVSILVVLLGITVLLCIFIVVNILSVPSQVRELEGLGETLSWVIFLTSGIVFILAGLILAAAIGMWIGATWGWWLGTTGYAFSVVLNVAGMMIVTVMNPQAEALSSSYIKNGTRAFIAGLIVLYLFQDNVLAYFRLQNWSKGKLFGVLAGITLGLYAAHFLIVQIVFAALVVNVGE